MYENDIEINAAVIWHLLADHGAMSIRDLSEQTDFREAFILLSLGWLAREKKIHFFEKNGILRIELCASVSEMYY